MIWHSAFSYLWLNHLRLVWLFSSRRLLCYPSSASQQIALLSLIYCHRCFVCVVKGNWQYFVRLCIMCYIRRTRWKIFFIDICSTCKLDANQNSYCSIAIFKILKKRIAVWWDSRTLSRKESLSREFTRYSSAHRNLVPMRLNTSSIHYLHLGE